MAALLLAGMALGAPDSNRVVQASEILAKIEHGEPVEYDGVIVEGDLNFLEILVESPINITNSEFRGVLSFNNIFYKNVCLRKNEFNKDVYFGSQFKEYVDFGGCEFKGYAGFIATQFLKDTNFSEVIFVKDVRFAGPNQRSAFYGFANFEGCQFNKIADFGGYDGGGTDFIGYVSFKNAIFNEDVSFAGHHSGASFNENANFQNARFGGNAYFSRSYGRADFKKGSDFTRAQFDGYVKFGGRYESANFDGPTIFDYVTFNDVVDFTNVIFSKNANFRYAQFKRDSDFIEAQFGSYSVFSDALFIRDADFRYAQFNREADFSDAKFGGYSVFSNAQFLGNVDFRNAKFDDNVYFENTSMNILYANETKFNGRVFISWKLIQHLIIGDYNREIAFYLDLMENYKKIGWFGDFNSCYYHYRQACRIHNLGFEKNTDTLEWIVYGYGVKPLYTLTWIIIFVMSFGLYFKKFDGIKKYISEEREEDPTDESTGGGTSEAVEIKTILKREDLTFIDPFLFSLTNFTSGLTSFLYPSVLYRAEKHRRLVILERLLGSVFLALLITAISKTYLIR